LPATNSAVPQPSLRINEIFFSLQGETSRVGLPTVFIRLTGCPLRCTYCDTTYAFQEGETLTLEEILGTVVQFHARYVTVTGGEPLAQKNCLPLLRQLCDAGYSVSLETGGALDISKVDPRVSKILDIKTPGSGEADKNRWKNLEWLTLQDEVKFVLCGEEDYVWAKRVLDERNVAQRCQVLFSAAQGQLEPATLAEWILRDNVPVRLQIQLHKLLWGEGRGK
jgi:7-carboxy-7-deazaguanine synthase